MSATVPTHQHQLCLSLCMIVKNEQANLPRCLASAKPYVDEMIVVDTGSEDDTLAIATQYGAKVSHFRWCNDFAAARNYALSQASGDWILVLDADEELIVASEDWRKVLDLQSEILAYSLDLVDDYLQAQQRVGGRWMDRLFRNIPEIQFTGRIHEELVYQHQGFPEGTRSILESLKIWHHGYDAEKMRHKGLTRNIPLLETIRQEEGLSLWLLYGLATTYQFVQQPEKADACFAELFERLLPNLTSGEKPEDFFGVPTLLHFFGQHFLKQGNVETARLISQRGLEWCPLFPPLNHLAADVLITLGFPLGAIPYLEKCLQMGRENSYYSKEPFDKVFVTTWAAYGLGHAHHQLQQLQDAIAAFELALSFDPNFTPAQHRLEQLVIRNS